MSGYSILTFKRGRLCLPLTLIGCVALLLLALLYLWLVRLGPFAHQPPGGYPVIDSQGDYTVFVYGTLRYAPVRWLVMGTAANARPAVLCGYRKQGLDLVEESHGKTTGLVITVTGQQLRRLDRYERLGIRYQRMQYTLADGTRAWVYTRLSDPVREPKEPGGADSRRCAQAFQIARLTSLIHSECPYA